jgi:hypothetical protein
VRIPIQCTQLAKVFGNADSGGQGPQFRRSAACTREAVEEHLRAVVEPCNDGLGEEKHREAQDRLDAEDGKANEEGNVFLE